MTVKRSFSLAGHRTSLALEPAFWDALEAIAAKRGVSLSRLVQDIDTARAVENLASACRLEALAFYRDGIDENDQPPGAGSI